MKNAGDVCDSDLLPFDCYPQRMGDVVWSGS